MVKQILIKVNPNYKDNSLGIKCDADPNLTIADFIRVVDSLGEEHIKLLKNYLKDKPEQNYESITFKDLTN